MRTKIKTMEPKTYQNKPNGFKIVLEDGTEGNLVEKDSDKGLRVGDTVEATITDYVSKSKGTHSNLITLKLISESVQNPVQTETKTTPPVGIPQSNDMVKKIKSEAAIRMMERAMDLFVKEDLDWDKMQERQEYVTRLVWGEIDEIYGLK
jgi:hypothetical protein